MAAYVTIFVSLKHSLTHSNTNTNTGSIQNWIEPRCIVTAVQGQNITIDPDCWKDLIARHGGQNPGIPTFVENVVDSVVDTLERGMKALKVF